MKILLTSLCCCLGLGETKTLIWSDEFDFLDELDEEDEEFVQTFDVTEKLGSKDFPRFFIKELHGSEVKAERLQ